MPATTTKNQTAHDAYVDNYAETMTNIKRLQVYLETHAMKEAADQRNWGYAGDLGRINNLVLEALGEGK